MDLASNQCNKDIAEKDLLLLIKGVVGRYIQRRAIPTREREDVEMEIFEKFLMQKVKIVRNFEGKSKFSTYCIAVLNRMCCEVIRKDSRQWYLVSEKENTTAREEIAISNHDTEKRLLFKQEIKRLESILFFFNADYAKLILFIKVYYGMPIQHNEIKDYANHYSDQVKDILLNANNTKKGDIFARLARMVNVVEQKDIEGDAVRIWFTNQVNTIIRRLNGNGIANHDKESLSILFEMLFSDSYSKIN